MEESAKLLFESDDYKFFKSLKINTISNDIVNNNSNKKFNILSNSILRRKSNYNPEERIRVDINEIKKKFDNIDLDFNELFDFHTKILNKRHFNRNLIMKFNLKQINLESLKEKYSHRVSFLIGRNYKNIEDIMKSNSRIEALMKKFAYYKDNPKEINPTIVFEELYSNKNEEFYNKCSKVIEIVKSFLDIFSLIIENNDCENLEEVNDIYHKIKEYFKFLSEISNLTKDNYMKFLFHSFESISNKKLKEIPESELLVTYKETNEENQIKFARLKSYYLKNKQLFYSVKLNYLDSIAYSLDFIKVEEIFSLIIDLTTKIKHLSSNHPSLRDHLTTKLSPTKPKKKNHQQFLSLEPSQGFSVHKEEEEEREETNSVNEEIFTSIYSKRFVPKKKQVNKKGMISNFMDPFEEKNKYFSNLNGNIMNIKKDTKSRIKDNFSLMRKQDEIVKISNEMILYNNPNLNLDALSNNTYNTFVKQIINTQNVLNVTRNKKLNKHFSNPDFSKK